MRFSKISAIALSAMLVPAILPMSVVPTIAATPKKKARKVATPSLTAVTTPAASRGNPGDWITEDDYPALAAKEGREGRTTVRFLIGPEGKATSCVVVSSSRHADLDTATCSLIMRRARFRAATNYRGDPVPSSMTKGIVWRLPAYEPPTQVAAAQPRYVPSYQPAYSEPIIDEPEYEPEPAPPVQSSWNQFNQQFNQQAMDLYRRKMGQPPAAPAYVPPRPAYTPPRPSYTPPSSSYTSPGQVTARATGTPATQCLSISSRGLENSCSYYVEAAWCVENKDCGTGHFRNQATISPGSYYPYDGKSSGNRVNYGGCRGRNTITGYTTSPANSYTFACRYSGE
jgi:TonB family protein